LGICFANLAFLDYQYATQRPPERITKSQLTSLIRSLIPSVDSTSKTATSAASNKAGMSTAPTPAPTASTQKAHVLRESFITIGNGSFHSEYDWGDVSGAQVTIDGASYGHITSAVFEATVNEPNGAEDVWLRLYDVTDKRPVWNSEMFYPNGSATRFLVSPQITIDAQTKIYQVQMKTQFRTNASLDLARIHLFSY
jgi:hypothetical protein